MAPLLRRHQRIALVLASDPATYPRRGDIVAVRAADGILVLHRFLGLDAKGRLLTRGDNSPRVDPPWERSALLGVLAAAESPSGDWRRPSRWTGLLMAASGRFPVAARRALGRWLLAAAWKHPHGGASTPEGALIPVMAAGCERWDVQQLGSEWAIYDSETGAVHLLNSTARQIWEFARAGLDNARILTELTGRYPAIPPAILTRDLEATMDLLHAKRLLDTKP